MSNIKKWMGSKPERCDLCDAQFGKVFYDAKTRRGPWGLLCRVGDNME